MAPLSGIWGVWGGMAPGGWCSFEKPGLTVRFLMSSRREDAEEGKLRAEKAWPEFTYEVAPFDHEREPAFRDVLATREQWTLLDIIRRAGTLNTDLPENYEPTLDALWSNGWYRKAVRWDGSYEPGLQIRLTAAGERAWKRGGH
jgi:hypothetical protein